MNERTASNSPGEDELRRLPLLARARADSRVRRRTAITIGLCVVFFAVAVLWLPRLATALEWFFGIFMAILAAFEVWNLLSGWRRRRSLVLHVPQPLRPLSPVERQAAMLVSRILLDKQEEVAAARSSGDFSKLQADIQMAASAFFLIAGENDDAFAALHAQLIRILGGGDGRPFAGYQFRPHRTAV